MRLSARDSCKRVAEEYPCPQGSKASELPSQGEGGGFPYLVSGVFGAAVNLAVICFPLQNVLSRPTSLTITITRHQINIHRPASLTVLQNPLSRNALVTYLLKNHDSIADPGKHGICASSTAATFIAAKNKHCRRVFVSLALRSDHEQSWTSR
jgi:hypothetical protein